MATVVHNAPAEARGREGSSGAGWIVAIIALLAIVLLFLLAGSFFNGATPASDAGSGVELNVPESIDINTPTAGGAGATEVQ